MLVIDNKEDFKKLYKNKQMIYIDDLSADVYCDIPTNFCEDFKIKELYIFSDEKVIINEIPNRIRLFVMNNFKYYIDKTGREDKNSVETQLELRTNNYIAGNIII